MTELDALVADVVVRGAFDEPIDELSALLAEPATFNFARASPQLPHLP
jgi:hypothetical protein